MTDRSPVSIVAFAACTSLGYSLEPTLAAMGAGLNNFTDTGVANEFGYPTLAASLVESSLSRGARLAALLRHGLDDACPMLSRYGVRDLPMLIGVASDLSREEREIAETVLEEYRPFIRETTWLPHGRASTFAALAAGLEAVRTRSHRLVLVAGLDSLCAEAHVSSLVQAGRVLSPVTEGTIPGEAAAFALLGRTDDPLVDPATSVRLEAVALERAPIPFTRGQTVSADALTAAFRTLRRGGARRVHHVVAAHSGEGYFGRSFSHAYLREVELMPEPLEVELIADRIGDVGAAAGILGLAFSVYFMVENGGDGERRALVYSESDTGEVGAAIIDGAPTSWRRSIARRENTARS